ncbi:glutamate-1-semialdehyde 2,1-aminomutase [Blastopirellula marina]|uniref:Glutamate-1-semialdehyde 2,1-aminomutase n=1 Tax=Blastopirellula marina TaxID=124 RepID=A0A2S8GDV4_9BACT|nr:glutamate-1-semialdehyde 2,1-aminomutase [Blastopirellula marina]PQO42642.1 glutamate-1-semialdehyde-2,1-aminomutase [Blastopirellula marina]PTL46408.1 glutamate-1-semialdehyde-2,1-aminomutase [Blastopirellula marina]
MSRSKSHDIFARAKHLMPGGVNSPARAFGAVGGEPIVFERGEGAYLYDVDGNQYIDYIGSWGPMILGHLHPKVKEALHAAVDQGTSFGAPTERENKLAELIIEIIPSVQQVRLVNSGTEATMSAIRLARGFTGRDKIIKFAGNYHGHVDSLLVAAGSAAATLGVPNSPGVTAGTAKDTIVLPYNNADALQEAFERNKDQIAGVIFEPVVGNMGCVPPLPGYLQAIREICTNNGALMIMDEVMTGFRVAAGGAQELYGVTPDLTTLGKIVGGGLPIGAYGGRADIMGHILPAGEIFQAGTLSGNPLATATGIATLQTLKELNPYPELDKKTQTLEKGLLKAAQQANVGIVTARVGSMLTPFFHEGAVHNWDAAAQCDTKRYGKFFWELIERGVYFPCSQYEALFVSVAHTDDDIAKTIDAAQEAFLKIR